jgi:hypothetical protein
MFDMTHIAVAATNWNRAAAIAALYTMLAAVLWAFSHCKKGNPVKQFDRTNSGAIFANDRKRSETDPDRTGSLNVEG